MRSRFILGSAEHDVWLSRGEGGYRLHRGEGDPPEIALKSRPGGRMSLVVDDSEEPVAIAVSGDDIHVHLGGRSYHLRYQDPVRGLAGDAAGAAEDEARAPMPGTTVQVLVSAGAEVSPGDGLVIIESMKLETTIRAPRAGTIEAVHVRAGQSFDRDQVLVTLAKAA